MASRYRTWLESNSRNASSSVYDVLYGARVVALGFDRCSDRLSCC
jgi:hypothetical protein